MIYGGPEDYPTHDEEMTMVDLSDERRSKKSWLPQNGGADVTDGLVYQDRWGKPVCREHGAMNRVHPVERYYRCSEMRCGVGARLLEQEEQ